MPEDHRDWPPPRPNKTLADAMVGLAEAVNKRKPEPRPWLPALALGLLLAGITAAVWLYDWRWLVTGAVVYVALAVASELDVERRKRA